MNFSKLKLTEMLASGAGTSLASNANNKASQQAQASKQASATSNSIGAQGTMMSSKPTKNNISSPVKQRTTAAPQPTASMATPTTTVEQWSFWRQRSEIHKMMKEQSSDWRKELCEAVGVKDEVFHPYVDIMPHGDAKLKDAQKKAVVAAKKDGKKIYEQVDPKNRGRGKDKEGRNLRNITGSGTPDAPSFMDRLNQSRVDGGTTTPNKGAHLRTTPAPKNKNWSTPVVPPAMAADKAPPTKTPVTGTMRSGKIPMT